MTLIADLRSGQKSDIGRKRVGKPNQDSLGRYEPVSLSCPDFLYLVCDGMGGYKGGEIASQLAVATIVRTYRELADEPS
ncbi:MAG: protein phosphatase 2C domain-containing protein, partial [Patescibacteria group bacterium]